MGAPPVLRHGHLELHRRLEPHVAVRSGLDGHLREMDVVLWRRGGPRIEPGGGLGPHVRGRGQRVRQRGPQRLHRRRIHEQFQISSLSRTMALETLTLASPADFHVHLRQATLLQLVVPHLYPSGVRLMYAMPNLLPPLTLPEHAVAYLATLEALEPRIKFLTTLYLSSELTPELIRTAWAAGVVGVKSYPRGVTTNSDAGVGMEGYAVYDDVFGEMEKCGMVLNLHGEVPSDLDGNVSSLTTLAMSRADAML